MYFGKPTSSFGYYRGTPYAGGGDDSGMGPLMAGNSVFSSGQGATGVNASGWTPTVLYLFVLILIEMFVFAFIGRHI